MRMFQSVLGQSSEQSTAHYSSQPTVLHLKGVSDTISNWFENHQPQRTQISTITNAPFRSKLELNSLQVDCSHKFSEGIFSIPAIFKATSKCFSSLGCSDDKKWLDFSQLNQGSTCRDTLSCFVLQKRIISALTGHLASMHTYEYTLIYSS